MTELRWYGWGQADKTYALDQRPGARQFLNAALDLRGDEKFLPCAWEAIQVRASRLSDEHLRLLREMTSPGAIKTDARTRILHTYGKSYRDLVRLRRGALPHPPDAVVYPATADQVARVLAFCGENNCALIPFGGGSSVVGGIEPRDERITLTLDLARLNRVIALDELAQTALIEAGIFGPDLERELNARGFTLGHLPQSFEFSSLGGWIATRGAGVASTKFGKIEAMTQSVRVTTPRGIIETRAVPATAAGPSLLQLLIGSEGTLGVITAATMRVRRLPKTKDYRALLFKNFAAGVAAMRDLVQRDQWPAMVRLSDEAETRSFFALREASSGWKGLTERLGLQVVNALGYTFEQGALMILGFEDDPLAGAGRAICRAHGAFDLGHGVARAWLAERYATPYLRDVLLDQGILVDTLETATSWSNLERLHKALAQAIADATVQTGARALVMTHVSHAYRDGASLYVTFLARMARDNEIAQWETIKRAATDCIMANGGTVSHHHGVGYEHAAWLPQENGELGMAMLAALKQELDPDDVMNPGKCLAKRTLVQEAQPQRTDERFWNVPPSE